MKKLYATILYSGIFFGILFPFNFAGAYSVGTHAFLAKEIIDFYNKNFPQSKISRELADYLVDGARMEDNTPRYVNHFYDPVNNRGLADGGFRGQKSKDWAKDSVAQTAFLYRSLSPTEASILSLAQVEKIKSVFDQSDFTWEKAVDLYVDGREEEALFTLGHVIHLVEDMTVPDHVRNDAHPPYDDGGSPYENWTEKFNLENSDADLKSRLSGKNPVILDSLDSYFDELATYTNNNFYSADSISSFEFPKTEYTKQVGNYLYGYKKDEENNAYRIIAFKNKSIGNLEKLSSFGDSKLNSADGLEMIGSLNDGGKNYIIADYWDRLSVKSVQYGAGVIDLFFKEVEKEKQNRVAKPNLPTRYFGQVVDLLKDFIPNFRGNKNLNLASTIDLLNENNSENSNSESDNLNGPSIESEDTEFINAQDFDNDNQDEDINLAEEESNEITEAEEVIIPAVEKKSVQVCTFTTDKSPSRQKMLINEVAWMGGVKSANDEWIELRNISGGVLDISGWQLLDKSEQIKLTFGSLKLESGAYVLLERTDDGSIAEIKADGIYAGALSNSDEGLRLFDNECALMDEVIAGSDWPAGDASARRTMERASDLSWHTYAGSGRVSGEAPLFGTPKQDNSRPGIANSSSSAEPVASIAVTDDSGPAKILISEIQITGGTGKSNYDFIELYNPNTTQVNLNGYRLVKRTKTGTSDSSIKSWTTDVYIPAKGYYLWANNDYSDISATPDVTTSSTLSSDNGVAIRFGSADTGDLIDSVGWGAAANAFVENQAFSENPIANQSISRQSESDTNNNSVDYIKTLLSPKNSSNSGGFILPVAWSSQSASAVSHLLISEVYPDQTGANLDFLEIYNPNASGTQAISLAGWSLQVLSANATTTDKITKKNFENGNAVPASGFFLVGIDNFTGGDMSWASGSLNSTDGATIFLVNGTTTISDFEDARIIDKVAYGSGSGLMSPENEVAPMPESGKSLERKAIQSGLCISSTGSGEYLGNGCDTDDNSNNFETRSVSGAQKLSNLPEPRTAPSAVANLTSSYSTTTLKVSFGWDFSSDSTGATSTLSYVLQFATSTNPLEDHEALSATSTYSYKLSEVGIDYVFSIKAKDSDGLESPASSVTMQIPSILDSAYFYPDPRNSGRNVVELRYGSYPFIYPIQTTGEFRLAIIYKNQEAPAIPYFYSDTSYASSPEGVPPKIYGEWGRTIDGAWKFEHDNCAGAVSSGYTNLIFPDRNDYCSSAYGGVRNGAIDWRKKLEDLNLNVLLSQDQTAPVAGDYFTVGFYTHNGNNAQNLAAVDRQKYYFLSEVPEHAAPTTPDNLELSFNQNASLLRIIWDKSTDADTLDSTLTYEVNYGTGELSEDGWITAPNVSLNPGEASEIHGRGYTKISLDPNTAYNIGLRAKDDFGNVSIVATTSYTTPDAVLPYGMANFAWGNIDNSGDLKISFDANAYPFMSSSNKATAIMFFLNQKAPSGHSFSNNTVRWQIGGDNDVLKLKYSTCNDANDYILGALLMHNDDSCPNGSGLKKNNTRNDLSSGQTNFITGISGVLDGGNEVTHNFTGEDYITLGFYELSGSTFSEVSIYNKKIYFTE